MFVDRVLITVRAGDGGAGVVSFRRVKGRPRGRPEGGSGGAGGDVHLRADESASTLLTYQRHPHHHASSGRHGQGDLRHGGEGEDLVLPVPPGTVVRDPDGTILADLVIPGQKVMVARGGRGGRGNAAFVGRAHRAPTFAEQGEYGEERTLALELKLLADAAIVGYPNAGKSTLIARVSAARPKIADYPFTTLEPHLGVVEIDDRQFVLADIPGLIEGAAQGKGLGHEFLRHTERARALVMLLDPSPLQQAAAHRQLAVLEQELAAYSEELAARPRIVAVNKADLPEATGAAADMQERSVDVHLVSAATGRGIPRLLHAIADAVEQARRFAPERSGFVLHRPAPPRFEVRREESTWVVEGREAERAVALDDLTLPEAADLVARRLAGLGVDKALLRAGAQAGDDVRIGGLVFSFEPEETDEDTSSAQS